MSIRIDAFGVFVANRLFLNNRFAGTFSFVMLSKFLEGILFYQFQLHINLSAY